MMRDQKNNATDPLDVLAKPVVRPDSPVRASMAKTMNADLIINQHAQVWLAHDKPFPGVLQWVEYDVDMGTLVFILDDGRMQDFGMRVEPAMGRYLRQSKMIDAVLVFDKKIHDFARVPVLVRDTIQ